MWFLFSTFVADTYGYFVCQTCPNADCWPKPHNPQSRINLALQWHRKRARTSATRFIENQVHLPANAGLLIASATCGLATQLWSNPSTHKGALTADLALGRYRAPDQFAQAKLACHLTPALSCTAQIVLRTIWLIIIVPSSGSRPPHGFCEPTSGQFNAL